MKIKSENELVRELINRELVTSDLIEKAYEYQKVNNSSLLKALIVLKIIPEDTLFTFVAKFLQIEYVENINNITIDKSCLERVPAKIAFRYNIIPINFKNDKLTICISNPFDMHMLDDIRTIVNYSINIIIMEFTL